MRQTGVFLYFIDVLNGMKRTFVVFLEYQGHNDKLNFLFFHKIFLQAITSHTEIYTRTTGRDEMEFSSNNAAHMRHLQLDYLGFSLMKAE